MREPIMTTFTGKVVNPFDPKPELICIEDIAHHLAIVNRFVGATFFPISVAYHSFVASLLSDREHALQALLHDASEAYLGDVNKWIKESPEFARYREIEAHVQEVIYRKFGCEETDHAEVERVDRLAVRYEAAVATRIYESKQFSHARMQDKYQPITLYEERTFADLNWRPVSWQEAESLFLFEFHTLTGGRYAPKNPQC